MTTGIILISPDWQHPGVSVAERIIGCDSGVKFNFEETPLVIVITPRLNVTSFSQHLTGKDSIAAHGIGCQRSNNQIGSCRHPFAVSIDAIENSAAIVGEYD